MKKILFASLIALATIPAYAADAAAKPKTAQQQKMADCSTKSKGLKGAEYKKSVSDCLKGDTAAAPAAADPAADKKAACEAAAVSKAGKPLAGAAKNSSVQACLKKAA